jgi:hypothetical protein
MGQPSSGTHFDGFHKTIPPSKLRAHSILKKDERAISRASILSLWISSKPLAFIQLSRGPIHV